jgi:hypothetical protein
MTAKTFKEAYGDDEATLLLSGSSSLTILPSLCKDYPPPRASLDSVALLASAPNVLVTSKKLKVKTAAAR